MVSGCTVCGRDLRRYGNAAGGNVLDGYSSGSNLCKDCNRRELRARGLGRLADKDERDDKIVSAFWTVALWGLGIFAVLLLIGVIASV